MNKKLLNDYCDYIIAEYVKAGGDIKDANRSFTYNTLSGILYREGKDSLDKFIKSWKPHVTPKRKVGYTGIKKL